MLGVLAAALALGAAAAASTGSQRFFFTGGTHPVNCEIDVGLPGLPTSTFCVVFTNTGFTCALLKRSGVTAVTHGVSCEGDPPEHAESLNQGKSIISGPFRCTAVRAGVRCVVAKTGHGFVLGTHVFKRVP